MSYLTDDARAATRAALPTIDMGSESLEAIVAANPERRTILRNGLFGLSILPLLGVLGACGEDDGTTVPTGSTPAATPTPTPAVSFAVNFASVPANQDDRVTVPAGYTVDVLFSAGDVVEAGAPGYRGAFQPSGETEKQAGGNHDGMEFYEIAGADVNARGLLAINHEYPDLNILFSGNINNPAALTPEQRALALSAVGVSVIEVAKGTDGKWAVVPGSRFNKRYTGNSNYRPAGPAASRLSSSIKGTLNNCASGRTPWGTYLTCEESTENYIDTTQPAANYGWVVELDPYGEILPVPAKRTAMGRFDHENVATMVDANDRTAFYMGDDGTPGCIYKFVPDRAFSRTDRRANVDLLDSGTLYVARFNANGTGEWRALVQGTNGLTPGATDPGNVSQGPTTPTVVNFANQADVLVNTKSAARVAGGTVMDRPEWITVAPDNSSIYCALTNNSSRRVVDASNPRVTNRHGHIIKWREAGNSPLATTFTWEIFVLAGDPSLASGGANLVGDIRGDTYSSPDGIRIDPQGRLWVQTDHSVPGDSGVAGRSIDAVFGHNAMFYIDQVSKQTKRFLVGPLGCEITGIAYTADLRSFFVNVQHPTGAWPVAGQQPRSSTIVVRRTDAQTVGT